jgi:hypothetical protein
MHAWCVGIGRIRGDLKARVKPGTMDVFGDENLPHQSILLVKTSSAFEKVAFTRPMKPVSFKV